jgi:carbonic anhydrase/acetyltransferase-like protein (isoleucine patch superfamily)
VDTGHPCRIGDDVTIGHGAVLHGCTIGDNTLVGMGAVVLNDAVIGENCIIGARALVTGGKVFPAGSLIMGVPAKVVRPLTEAEIESNRASAAHYVRSACDVKDHLAHKGQEVR